MIRQYIKLFLESNEESDEDQPTFHAVLKNTSDELSRSNQNQDSEENSYNNNSNDNTRLNTDETGMAWLLRNNK